MNRLERTAAARRCLAWTLAQLAEEVDDPALQDLAHRLADVLRASEEVDRAEKAVAACHRRVLAVGAAGRRN